MKPKQRRSQIRREWKRREKGKRGSERPAETAAVERRAEPEMTAVERSMLLDYNRRLRRGRLKEMSLDELRKWDRVSYYERSAIRREFKLLDQSNTAIGVARTTGLSAHRIREIATS